MLTTQKTISVCGKLEVGFGGSAKERRKGENGISMALYISRCPKEKVSQGRQWNAGRTDSGTNLFHPRNLPGFEGKLRCWRRRKPVLEEAA